jgi:hypothetical protein
MSFWGARGVCEAMHILAAIANDSLWGVSFFIEEVSLFLVKSKSSLY